MYAWRKQQRIRLLHTISVVTATVNPEKAQKALTNLIEEMFPEQQFERAKAVERALTIMEEERHRVYAVSARYPEKKRGLIKKINKVLSRGEHH